MFRPIDRYSDEGIRYRLKYGKDLECGITVFVDLLLAEVRLREQVQIEEYLLTKPQDPRREKLSDETEPPQYDERLEQVRKEIGICALDLYNRESMLPDPPLRQMYNKLRKDPKWYLRKELVDDCIAKEGCCARECGCCEKRHVGEGTRKGIGHCTVECGCCAIHRRFEFTKKEKDKLARTRHDLLRHNNPSYLIASLEPFFSEIEPPQPGQSPQSPQKHTNKSWGFGRFKK